MTASERRYAAFEAIVSTMPVGSVGFENNRASNRDLFIWIPHDVLAPLNHLREPGEDYSDGIRRVVCTSPLRVQQSGGLATWLSATLRRTVNYRGKLFAAQFRVYSRG